MSEHAFLFSRWLCRGLRIGYRIMRRNGPRFWSGRCGGFGCWNGCHVSSTHPGPVGFLQDHIHGTQRRPKRSLRMDRHERIRLTVERIRVSKKLIAQQLEFIRLARVIGYEPVHAPTNLQKFREQLADQRSQLINLTRTGQRDFVNPEREFESIRQKAA
jgi:hypothetical protein